MSGNEQKVKEHNFETQPHCPGRWMYVAYVHPTAPDTVVFRVMF